MDSEGKELLLQALEAARRGSAEARFVDRLHCVLLVAQGRTAQEVAQWYRADPSSVARWVRRFRESGLEGLREGRRSGRPGRLDEQISEALRADLEKPPYGFRYSQAAWNGNLLATHLEQRYGVSLSVRQCQRILRQLSPPAAEPSDADPPSGP